MAFYLRNDDLFESNMALRCEVKAQAKIIDEFKSGERYLKLQRDHRKVIDGYIREIKKLRAELAKSHAETVNVRNMWLDECDEVWHEHVAGIAGKDAKIRRLEEKIWELQQKHDDADLIYRLQTRQIMHIGLANWRKIPLDFSFVFCYTVKARKQGSLAIVKEVSLCRRLYITCLSRKE